MCANWFSLDRKSTAKFVQNNVWEAYKQTNQKLSRKVSDINVDKIKTEKKKSTRSKIMSALKQKYEEFAEFMQHNTKGVEVSIFLWWLCFFSFNFIACEKKLCSTHFNMR